LHASKVLFGSGFAAGVELNLINSILYLRGRMKRVVISVTNDLSTDQRVDKVAQTLTKLGLEVLLVGRLLPGSLAISREYQTHRMKLLFNKGPIFYAEYNFRLFLFLLFNRANILLANDLDTLLANYLVSGIKRIPLVYDSHELYTEVPELVSRPKVQAIWLKIEQWIFPKLKHVYTVNKSIAEIYQAKYNVTVQVIRNLPRIEQLQKTASRQSLGLPENKKVIILQGAGINMDRGGEELIEAMALLPEYFLAVVGSGDVLEALKSRTEQLGIAGRVIFKPKMPYADMMQYTLNADLGVTLDKDTNLNYRYSLPNKIFDYIKAGIPVLSSNLPELRNVIESYDIGAIFLSHQPKVIADTIHQILSDEPRMLRYRENTKFAAAKLNWESQEPQLAKIFETLV
jgi:glycosyltransferase involved in cell wall biosynthesis